MVVPDAAKAQVKQLVPRALGSPHSKVRTAAAMVVASVGRVDFPAKWPSLLTDLVACLASPNKLLSTGALKCLDFLATSKMADDQVPAFLGTVFPALHTVFVGSAFDEAAKSRAASVVSAVVLWVGAMASTNPQQYERVVAQSMQMWMDGFCSVLAARDSPKSGCQLKLKIVTILSSYAHYFPKLFRPYAPKCAELVWSALQQNVAVYEQVAVQADLLDGDVNDSDGNVVGFDLLIASYFDFISTLSSKKSFADIVTRMYPSLVKAVFYYAQLSHVQCEQFISDPNEFVAAEDDDLGAYSIRQVCVELVQFLASMHKAEFLKCLLKEALLLPKGNWKLRESFLYVVGSVMSDLRRHPELLDYASFVSSVVPDIGSDNPFLRGRALWCASQSRDLPVPLAGSICQAALRLLSNKREQLPVRFAAVKAVATLASVVPKDAVYAALRPAIESCCEIFPVSTPETINVALETLEALLKVHPKVCAEAAAFVCGQVVQIWKTYANNEFVTELVVDLITVLANVPESVPQLSAQLLPVLATLMNNPATEYYTVSTAIDLLALLVRGTPNCLASPVFAQLFVRVVAIALSTEEVALMQSTSKALACFVASGGPALAQFRAPGSGETGVAALLAVIRRMLDPKNSEDGAIFVGKLILKMIQTLDMTSVTPQILSAILPRLGCTNSPLLVQTLVLVFARLIHSNPANVLDFLAKSKTPDGGSALSFLLTVWVENQTAFYGAYQTKVTLFALVALFRLNSPQINAIKVRGPEVAPTGRSMRSKGPIRYTEISIQQKIFEICVATFVEKVLDTEEGHSEEEMDGFSSEEDLNLDGSEFDHMGEGGHPLDKLLRMANNEEMDEEDEEDPEFRDDPINKMDVLVGLREFLMSLMKASPKAFEQSVGNCGDLETKQMFYKIWPSQVQTYFQQQKK